MQESTYADHVNVPSRKNLSKADKMARSQKAGAQPIQHRPSISRKATNPAGDWISRQTPCIQCSKQNDHTSNQTCVQCSRKAHKACVTERNKRTNSRTLIRRPKTHAWSVEKRVRYKRTNDAAPVLALPSFTKHVRKS